MKDDVALVVGVDGCPSGWIAVSESANGAITSSVYGLPDALMAAYCNAAVIAVDVPIGLTDREPRQCDLDARSALGRPRGSSVFPPPIRAALRAVTRDEACAIQHAVNGKRIGVQSWGIMPKIQEWDEWLQANSELAPRVYEVHPEVCFWAMANEGAMRHKKSRSEGRAERRDLLVREFSAEALDAARRKHAKSDVKDDDLYDAFAALWTARRIVRRKCQSLPQQPPQDTVGLRMAIWY